MATTTRPIFGNGTQSDFFVLPQYLWAYVLEVEKYSVGNGCFGSGKQTEIQMLDKVMVYIGMIGKTLENEVVLMLLYTRKYGNRETKNVLKLKDSKLDRAG